MLQLLNKGRNPFPHLKGMGGLHYHPSRHMIGGRSIIKPSERVSYHDAHIIGGMIGNELVLSPDETQLISDVDRFLSKPTQIHDEENEDEENEEESEPQKEPSLLSTKIDESNQLIFKKDKNELYTIAKFNVSNLQEALKYRSLDITGTKKELYDRLSTYVSKNGRKIKKIKEKPIVIKPIKNEVTIDPKKVDKINTLINDRKTKFEQTIKSMDGIVEKYHSMPTDTEKEQIVCIRFVMVNFKLIKEIIDDNISFKNHIIDVIS